MLRLCIHSFPCLALILRNYKLLYQHSVCHPPKKGQHETTRYQRNNGKVPRTHKNEKCTFEKFDIPPKWLHPQQSDRQTRSTLSPTQPNSTPSTPNPTSPREENLHQTHTQNHPPKAARPRSPGGPEPRAGGAKTSPPLPSTKPPSRTKAPYRARKKKPHLPLPSQLLNPTYLPLSYISHSLSPYLNTFPDISSTILSPPLLKANLHYTQPPIYIINNTPYLNQGSRGSHESGVEEMQTND